jgi:hypothetical protein
MVTTLPILQVTVKESDKSILAKAGWKSTKEVKRIEGNHELAEYTIDWERYIAMEILFDSGFVDAGGVDFYLIIFSFCRKLVYRRE